MARRPPARRMDEIEPDTTPIDDAINVDQMGIADALGSVLDTLRDFDQGSIKGILYRKPSGGIGKYEWIEELSPPFDLSAIFADLKERFGGGDFQIRIMAAGRIRKNVDFSIAKEKNPLIAPQKDNSNSDTFAMMQLMMMQQSEASKAARESADRQMQMMMQMGQQSTQMMMGMMTAIVPALAGGREKTSELMQAIAAMQPKGDGMKDTIETLAAMKGLFKEEGGSGGGFDPEDIVGSVAKLAGPVAGAIGKAFSGRGGAAEQPVTQVQYEAPPALMLGQPDQAVPSAPTGSGRFPVLALIRDDVLYTFNRGHDPQRAADLVYDTIENAGVTEDQINELVAAFSISPNWLEDLAFEGIDLRGNPEWASEFLQSLIAIHTDPERDGSDFGGGNGGSSNPGENGGTGAQG